MYAGDNHGSGNHPVVIKDTHDSEGRHNSMAMLLMVIFIVFIIFAIIIFFAFFARREQRDGNGLETIAAATALRSIPAGGEYAHRDDYKMWDHSRDDLKEFGHVREEIKTVGWTLSREADNRYHETARQIGETKHQSEMQAANIRSEIAASERRVMDRLAYDREKRLEDELSKERMARQTDILMCPRPMYAYSPPPPVETRRYCYEGQRAG